jgi:spectinomycin phosphotransferase
VIRNGTPIMLEKPHLPDEKIAACLRDQYNLRVSEVTFLPLGADPNTAVYRVIADQTPYFLKLRTGNFDEMAVLIPGFLRDQGIEQIIPPIPTSDGQLWAKLDDYHVILSPFVEGRDAYEVELSDQHWIEFGQAFRQMHTAPMPPALRERIQKETYAPEWRELVKGIQSRVEHDPFPEPIAAKVAALIREKRPVIDQLVGQAERLAKVLQQQPQEFVLCHADMHAGNILIDTSGVLYIVDWDTLILAPKERDLMFIGGGLMNNVRSADEEIHLFYQGYGETKINPVALAYYRNERIVQDISVYCRDILLTDEGGEDREVGYRQLAYQFQPNQVIDLAFRTEKSLSPDLQFQNR